MPDYKTVLVVEDEPGGRMLIAEALRRNGYLVFDVANGKQALSMLDGTRHFDLVITDLNMPEMNGVELTKEIRLTKDYRRIPVLMLSSDTSDQKKQMAVESTITGWIQKPVEPAKLLQLVARATRPREV